MHSHSDCLFILDTLRQFDIYMYIENIICIKLVLNEYIFMTVTILRYSLRPRLISSGTNGIHMISPQTRV